MHALPVALADAALRAGVSIRYGARVGEILRRSDRAGVAGVTLEDGEKLPADVVVSTIDTAEDYPRLLTDLRPPCGARRGHYAPSAVVWHVGVKGRPSEQAAHHNIHFTVPLLLIETVAVMSLQRSDQRSLLFKLVPASALMIALGYLGEISTSTGTRVLFGLLSTIPFIYLLYVLFVELSRSLDRQPPEVTHTIKMLRPPPLAMAGLPVPTRRGYSAIGLRFVTGAVPPVDGGSSA